MLQDIYVNTRKENKMPKVKIKFRMLTYCEKEYKIVNQELWDKNKDNFVALASEYRTYIKNKNWKNTLK